jgi:xanthine dehydrogenase accessory factor
MTDDFFERIVALRREGRPFAVATVVGRHAPVSAHLGDRAIVFADGRMEGFVGGACSREIVRKQALEALAVRQGRLVSIRPDEREPIESTRAERSRRAAPERGRTAEHIVVPMTCASEGSVDVYVEPFVQPRTMIVAGTTPVADAVARLSAGMDYDVVRVVDDREIGDIEAACTALGIKVVPLDQLSTLAQQRAADVFAVVASQGHYDEEALEALLKAGVSYVGLVASRKRGATVRSLLTGIGVPGTDRMRSPAGLDLGARTPSEVALSILAEIVQLCSAGLQPPDTLAGLQTRDAEAGLDTREADSAGLKTGEDEATTSTPGTAAITAAVDPVCGMDVDPATARHTAEVGGQMYYFCCASCRASFLADPQPYLSRQ